MVVARGSTRQASEVELKLEFDPADAARLASHRALDAGLAPPEDQDLVSIYFDTPDGALHRLGVYLRVRDKGGRYVQTVKTAKSKTELLERLEWERDVPSRRLDLDGLEGTALGPLLTPELRASLQPVFETRIKRHICRIEQDGSEIEVAIDRGEIATRTQTRPISELELELKRGEKKALFRLAHILAETVPFKLGSRPRPSAVTSFFETAATRRRRPPPSTSHPTWRLAMRFALSRSVVSGRSWPTSR